ncbi:MAG: hypothetical protein ACXW3C_10215, partial [Pyrinomonadaceae bacterium]
MSKVRPNRITRRVSYFILHPSSFILLIALLCLITGFGASTRSQTRQRGAHSTTTKNAFTPADRRLVERAIGATCAERIRDPQGSMSIDEMQARPSLPISNPEAVAGARRAERLLPTTRTLVTKAIVQLAKDYQLYATALQRNRI